jgi:polysaccharide export outer membrane protein
VPLAGLVRYTFVSAAFLAALQLISACASAQVVVGESPQQTNDRIQQLSKNLQTIHFSAHEYVIGSGDVLDIEVFEVNELSREVRVNQTGTIALPLVSTRLHVAGLTELQAQRKIAEVLEAEGLVSHPEVTVTVREHRSKPITVVGAVGHPMVYQADGPVSLIEVLAEAGGIANDAGDTVIITRPVQPANSADTNDSASSANASASQLAPGEPPALDAEPELPAPSPKQPLATSPAQPPILPASPATSTPTPSSPSTTQAPAATASSATPSHPTNAITVNLNELVEKGDSSNNITLQAGDIVTVPHAGIVYVLGAVGRPGGFVLSNDRSQMTALKMLALAGGLTPTAKSNRAVIIRKDTHGQEHEVTIDLKRIEKRQVEDVALFPSDIVYVPESGAKSTLLKAASLGVAIGTGLALYRLAYR